MKNAPVTWDRNPDEAVILARNDYVFFGKPVTYLVKKYNIDQSLLGEMIFVGENCWRELRAKVEEDELDSLINSNLHMLSKGLYSGLSSLGEFLETHQAVEDWGEAEQLMKLIQHMTKAADVLKKLQEHRIPIKANRDVHSGEEVKAYLPGDEGDPAENSYDEYADKRDQGEELLSEEEMALVDMLDNLV